MIQGLAMHNQIQFKCIYGLNKKKFLYYNLPLDLLISMDIQYLSIDEQQSTVSSITTTTNSPTSSCSQGSSNSSPLPPDCDAYNETDSDDGNIIVNVNELVSNINKNFTCLQCTNKIRDDSLDNFVKYVHSAQEQIKEQANLFEFRSEKQQREWIQNNTKSTVTLLHDYKQMSEGTCISQPPVPFGDVKIDTIMAASTITGKCKLCLRKTSIKPRRIVVKSKKHGNCSTKSDPRKRVSYQINNQLVAGVQSCGGGRTQAETILSFLGLPICKRLGDKFSDLERVVGESEKNMQSKLQNEALEEEIEATKEIEGEKCMHERSNLPKLTVSYDMGWSKRSSGRRYDSQSGHCHIIGLYTRKVIGSHVYCKVCRICQMARVKGKEVQTHNCAQNYSSEKSSKSMESDAILHICKNSVNRGFIIGTIISDDDSNMRATLKHKNNINKSGRLPVSFCVTLFLIFSLNCILIIMFIIVLSQNNLPEPTFLADPTHRVKVFANWVYKLATAKMSISKVKKSHAERLKKYWGSFIKQTRWTNLDNMREASKAPLEHLFNNHVFCEEKWCMCLKAQKEGKVYVSRDGPFLCKVANKEEYEQLKKITDQFSTDQRLLESMHGGDTQANESLNMTLSYYAPKTINYSQTPSLTYRVAINVGLHTTTYTRFWCGVFQSLGIRPCNHFKRYLERKDIARERARKYKSTGAYKRKRKHKQNAAQLEQIYQQQAIEKSQSSNYGSGIGLNIQLPSSSRKKMKTSTTNKASDRPSNTDDLDNHTTGRCRCGSTSHKRTNHRDCPFNKKNVRASPDNDVIAITTSREEKSEIVLCEQIKDDGAKSTEDVSFSANNPNLVHKELNLVNEELHTQFIDEDNISDDDSISSRDNHVEELAEIDDYDNELDDFDDIVIDL